MKAFMLSTAFVCCVVLLACRQSAPPSPTAAVHQFVTQQLDSLHQVTALWGQACDAGATGDALQGMFCQARVHYKKVESLMEFYYPGTAKVINGPALRKAEEYDDKVIEPTGFQVIEELLFPAYETGDRGRLRENVEQLRAAVARMQQLHATGELSDTNIFEAVRLGVLRVMSLGLSGFDSPVALHSIAEARASLMGLRQVVTCYPIADEPLHNIRKTFDRADQYLQQHTDFNTFDRATFYTRYLNPLSQSLYAVQQSLHISNNPWLTAVDMHQPTFFDEGVFQPDFFAPTHHRQMNTEVAKLGKMLFFDPVLSGNGQRACASCHQPAHAFAEGRATSTAFDGQGVVGRNAPTLIHAGFQRNQFWDQRVHFLEDQISDVLMNPREMHGNLQQAAVVLQRSTAYQALFRAAFPDVTTIQPDHIQTALAQYIRTLYSFHSRFDVYMRGNDAALSTEELAGFNIFMGKGKCGTCHFMPLFNGTVPPAFTETESEVLGVPHRPDTAHATLDGDVGKYAVYRRDLHRYAFKTPTLRNVALTAPYMHHGAYPTLESVIDFYDRGGGAGVGVDVAHQTLPTDPLALTAAEQKQLIAFLHTLTDTTTLTTTPHHLPPLHPDGAARRVGGAY